jgi:hypothetical protein
VSSGRGRSEASRGGGESGGGGGRGDEGAGGKKAISFAPGLGSPRSGRRVAERYVYYMIYIVY